MCVLGIVTDSAESTFLFCSLHFRLWCTSNLPWLSCAAPCVPRVPNCSLERSLNYYFCGCSWCVTCSINDGIPYAKLPMPRWSKSAGGLADSWSCVDWLHGKCGSAEIGVRKNSGSETTWRSLSVQNVPHVRVSEQSSKFGERVCTVVLSELGRSGELFHLLRRFLTLPETSKLACPASWNTSLLFSRSISLASSS